MKLIVVAGPNGSGKSTVIHTRKLDQEGYTYLSADSISKMLEDEILDESERIIAAWKKCEEWREKLIRSKESFVWETVFSDARRLDVLREAREIGYDIDLIFVTTKSADINVERVMRRVKAGGHNVPEEKIRSRYANTMFLLPEILSLCSRGFIYDNSVDERVPFLAIVFETGTIILNRHSPAWARETFGRITKKARLKNNIRIWRDPRVGLIADIGDSSEREKK